MITSRAVNDRVLLLEFLKLLRHLQIRSAELRPPAVVRLLADPQPSADIGHVHAIPKVNVSLPKQATICSALRRFFIREPVQAPGGARGFSHMTWIRIWGWGQGRTSPIDTGTDLRIFKDS